MPRTTRPECCRPHAEWARLGRRLRAIAGIHLLADEVYRFLEFDEADRLPAGADALPARRLARGHVEVVRDGRAADRLAGDAATASCSTACAAFKDYTTICSSAPSEILALIGAPARATRPRPVARDRRRQPALLDGFFRRLGGRVLVGPSARRLDRVPATCSGRPDRRLRGRARRGRGRPAPARLAVRPSRQPLPDRLRAGGPAGRARPARGVPRPRLNLAAGDPTILR